MRRIPHREVRMRAAAFAVAAFLSFAPVAAFGGTLTYPQTSYIFSSTNNVTLTVTAGSSADQVVVNASTIVVTLAAGDHFYLTDPGSRKLPNTGGLPECSVDSQGNHLNIGPVGSATTITVTPSAEACTTGNPGGNTNTPPSNGNTNVPTNGNVNAPTNGNVNVNINVNAPTNGNENANGNANGNVNGNVNEPTNGNANGNANVPTNGNVPTNANVPTNGNVPTNAPPPTGNANAPTVPPIEPPTGPTLPQPPAIVIPANGEVVGTATPPIAGTARAGSTVKLRLDGQVVGTVQTNANGTWSIIPDALSEGGHVIRAEADGLLSNEVHFVVKTKPNEVLPECSDGLDNDDDGKIDYPADGGCKTRTLGHEADDERTLLSTLTPFVPSLKPVTAVLQNPALQESTRTILAPAALAIVAANAAISLPTLGLLALLRFLFFQPLLLFRRRKGWGTVFNAMTKLPVDLAIVRLVDGKTDKLLRTTVTDKNGRFIFFVNPGTYRLEVTKPSHVFPSVYLKGKRSDYGYDDLYDGSPFVFEAPGVFAPNIAIDPVGEAKPDRVVLRDAFRARVHASFAYVGIALAFGIFVIAPSVVNAIALGIHVFMWLAFRRLARAVKPRSWGVVSDAAHRKPIAATVVRVFEPTYNRLLETQVTDAAGRYAFLVGRNTYYLTASHPGYEPEKSEPIDLTQGPDKVVIAKNIALRAAGQGTSVPGTASTPTPPAAGAPPAMPTPPSGATPPPTGPSTPSGSVRDDNGLLSRGASGDEGPVAPSAVRPPSAPVESEDAWLSDEDAPSRPLPPVVMPMNPPGPMPIPPPPPQPWAPPSQQPSVDSGVRLPSTRPAATPPTDPSSPPVSAPDDPIPSSGRAPSDPPAGTQATGPVGSASPPPPPPPPTSPQPPVAPPSRPS